MDLTDAGTRTALSDRLMERYAGRPVVVGPGILAARTELIGWVREVGGRVLALVTALGAGPKPAEGECVVVDLDSPPTASVTEEMRALDHLARNLPAGAVAAIE